MEIAVFFGETLEIYYRPQTKLRKGNVFTSVCQEFCPQVGMSARHLPPGRLGRHPPTPPPGSPPPDRHTPAPQRRPLQRMVRILLEFILVSCYVYELLFLHLSGFLIQTVFCLVTHQTLRPIETPDTFLECVAYHFIQFVSLCTQPRVQNISCRKTMRSLTRRPK